MFQCHELSHDNRAKQRRKIEIPLDKKLSTIVRCFRFRLSTPQLEYYRTVRFATPRLSHDSAVIQIFIIPREKNIVKSKLVKIVPSTRFVCDFEDTTRQDCKILGTDENIPLVDEEN